MADSTAKLETLWALARSANGAVAAQIIHDATSTPGVYVFGEFLELPNIQQLSSHPEHAKSFALLNLFAFGTLDTHAAAPDAYPPLSPVQLNKLRHLSLLTCALQQRTLPYSLLLERLHLSDVRQLEDTIIETIYAGLLEGKMHHHEKELHVDWAVGRDVTPDELVNVKAKLSKWCTNASSLLAALDERIAAVQETSRAAAADKAQYDAERDRLYQQTAIEYKSRLASERAADVSSREAGPGRGGIGNRPFPSARNVPSMRDPWSSSSSEARARQQPVGSNDTVGESSTSRQRNLSGNLEQGRSTKRTKER